MVSVSRDKSKSKLKILDIGQFTVWKSHTSCCFVYILVPLYCQEMGLKKLKRAAEGSHLEMGCVPALSKLFKVRKIMNK